MANISASMVKELRERTGVGMMDCKKALAESNGDLEAAVDWLRTKGVAKAAKKASRTAAEGLIGIATNATKAAIVEVNAETDFVSRNEQFQDFVKHAAAIALQTEGDLATLLAEQYPETGRTVEEEVTHLVATIGENIILRRSQALSVNAGHVGSYIHTATAPGLGKIGVLVALEASTDASKLTEVAKQVAMHIAATNPQSCNIEDLDPQIIERERQVFTEQAQASGKPEEFIPKMVEGRLRKFYEQAVLVEQTFVVDGERKIKQVIEDAAKEAGAPIKIKGFVRFGLGEGIEKQETDFAAEVAAQLKT